MLSTIPSIRFGGAGHIEPVSVEVHVGPGLPGFDIVGQPSDTVREIRDRIRAAILSTGHDWPLQRITVDIRGMFIRPLGGHDLPIALGILQATGQLGTTPSAPVFAELGLDGRVHPPVVSPSAPVVKLSDFTNNNRGVRPVPTDT